jgi:hypothetical protein
MSDRFITWVIIGVSFGFTQLWFAYWVVKLFKEKQRIMKARRIAAGSDGTAGAAAKPSVPAGPAAGPPAP